MRLSRPPPSPQQRCAHDALPGSSCIWCLPFFALHCMSGCVYVCTFPCFRCCGWISACPLDALSRCGGRRTALRGDSRKLQCCGALLRDRGDRLTGMVSSPAPPVPADCLLFRPRTLLLFLFSTRVLTFLLPPSSRCGAVPAIPREPLTCAPGHPPPCRPCPHSLSLPPSPSVLQRPRSPTGPNGVVLLLSLMLLGLLLPLHDFPPPACVCARAAVTPPSHSGVVPFGSVVCDASVCMYVHTRAQGLSALGYGAFRSRFRLLFDLINRAAGPCGCVGSLCLVDGVQAAASFAMPPAALSR